MSKPLFLLALITGIALTGCSKKNPPESAQPQAATAPASADTPPTPPAQEATTPEDNELNAKKKAMAFALKDDEIKNDAKGQWAIKATASSSYANDLTDLQASYHPMQATGAPNVSTYSDDGNAWTPKDADSGIEWLELEYAKAVEAREIRIRQSYGAGAIIKVEAYDAAGAAQVVWSGPDSTDYSDNQISWLTIPIKPAPIKTQKLKITLATNMVGGWNEIDAVQLIGE
jgi:hypothetical protein